jgi:FdhD protein
MSEPAQGHVMGQTVASASSEPARVWGVAPPIARFRYSRWRGQIVTGGERMLPEEMPVALTYDGSSHAVMMATPADLEDFAIGFSLTEGVVETPDQVTALDIIPDEQGIELRMFLAPSQAETLCRRRRYRAGPTGCGLCGIESLSEPPPLHPVDSPLRATAASIRAALHGFEAHQQLNRQAHAIHAAASCRPGQDIVLREDIGRHNALDKLAGALTRGGIAAEEGFVVISSRVSIDMVQKGAVIGAPLIVALSAPSALAVRACDSAGVTLIAIAREDAFEVFTHPERVNGDPSCAPSAKPVEPPEVRDTPA